MRIPGQRTAWLKRLVSGELAIVGLVVCLLAPFLDKAVHIDDPLFIWTAKHIIVNPANFYGFNVNWLIETNPMWYANLNPPLTSYYLAAVGKLAGWSEPAMHAGFLLWSAVFAVGCLHLARFWCGQPLLATLLAIFSPVFMVTASTLMCDIPMAALWTWAMVCWARGLGAIRGPRPALFWGNKGSETDFDNVDQAQRFGPQKPGWLLAGAVLCGLAFLAKYTAVALLPLMLLYGFVYRRKAGSWMLALLLPVAVMVAYETATHSMYGHAHFSLARHVSLSVGPSFGSPAKTRILMGLSFMGGCFLPVLFYAPFLWRTRGLIIGVFCCFGFAMVALVFNRLGDAEMVKDGHTQVGLLLQTALLAATGLGVLILCLEPMRRSKDPVSWVLAAWVVGIFFFGAAVNWTISARAFLPALPAAAILMARRLEQPTLTHRRWMAWPLVPAAVLALAITWADFDLANSARDAAVKIVSAYPPAQRPVWFLGHWGFQYYMQLAGANPIDMQIMRVQKGDLLAVPWDNTGIRPPPADFVRDVSDFEMRPNKWLTTMKLSSGAGFYVAEAGPVPFAFGRIDPERYSILEFTTFVIKDPESKSR